MSYNISFMNEFTCAYINDSEVTKFAIMYLKMINLLINVLISCSAANLDGSAFEKKKRLNLSTPEMQCTLECFAS